VSEAAMGRTLRKLKRLRTVLEPPLVLRIFTPEN
jgi:hypothetical protein